MSAKALPKIVLCILLPLLATSGVKAEWLKDHRELMGTQISVELWADDVESGHTAIEKVFEEVQRLDEMMNPWNPNSELSRINRDAAEHAVTTTPEIIEVVSKALYYSRLSSGAFDISFASVGQHYDYRLGRAPDDITVRKDKANIDYSAIHLDTKASTLFFSKPGLQVDLGGIAKGYAVDRGIEILHRSGIVAAVISAGGDSRILGDLGNRPRVIGIRHPRKKDEYAVVVPLADTAISTSGDYERFFLEEGVRYHHILDPQTGRSAGEVQSASVITAKAIDSDALSTTSFVLGVERGLALINSLPGVDAIFIDGQGKLHYSEELLLSTK
ncbi:MAG: FAD:protein FMN transferase [Halioglobus sp.]